MLLFLSVAAIKGQPYKLREEVERAEEKWPMPGQANAIIVVGDKQQQQTTHSLTFLLLFLFPSWPSGTQAHH